LIIQ
jgi:hypothetical protein